MWNAVDPGALEDDVSVRVGAMTVVSAEDFGDDEADKHGRPAARAPTYSLAPTVRWCLAGTDGYILAGPDGYMVPEVLMSGHCLHAGQCKVCYSVTADWFPFGVCVLECADCLPRQPTGSLSVCSWTS